jgi:5-methylcytosine-specific restriction endonuclease McrA
MAELCVDQIEPEEGDFFEGLLLETCRDSHVSRPRVRPAALLPDWLRVEFPRDLREANPIGTRFRADVHVRRKHYSGGAQKGPLYLRAENHSIYKVAIPSGPRLLFARKQPGTISGRAYEYFWVKSTSASQREDFYRLRERAYRAAVDSVGTMVSEALGRERSRLIGDYVLRRANGICEGCEELAPFLRRNGQPYLEVHHIVPVANGGADSPFNVAAVCPNCHARVSHGKDGNEHNLKIKDRISCLEKELSERYKH